MNSVVSRRFSRLLVAAIYLFTVAAFFDDLLRANTLAYGIMYTPMVCTGLFYRARIAPWLLAALAIVMIVVGAFLPFFPSDLPDMIANRVLSILAILATAFFIRQARLANERLAAQTRRAEAAEQAKSDMLDSLSHEMRTPLHRLLGLLGLLMAGGSSNQREPLASVRESVKQLLTSIDNLIDLTRLNEFQPKPVPIDVGALVRDAVTRARPAATERQITMLLEDASPGMTPAAAGRPDAPFRDSHHVGAQADPWAARRILDNMLAHAVRVTPPGGTVSVALQEAKDGVTIGVTDAGNGLHPDLADLASADADGDPSSAAGSGLTLSLRLARAMNARLLRRDQPGGGTTLSLWLPLAAEAAAPAA